MTSTTHHIESQNNIACSTFKILTLLQDKRLIFV